MALCFAYSILSHRKILEAILSNLRGGHPGIAFLLFNGSSPPTGELENPMGLCIIWETWPWSSCSGKFVVMKGVKNPKSTQIIIEKPMWEKMKEHLSIAVCISLSSQQHPSHLLLVHPARRFWAAIRDNLQVVIFDVNDNAYTVKDVKVPPV